MPERRRRGQSRRPRMLLLLIAMTALAALDWTTIPARAVTGTRDSKGTDFWLAFPQNYFDTPSLTLFITGDTATTGSVDVAGFPPTPFTVTPGTVSAIPLDPLIELYGSDIIEPKGIHVTAGAEVTVYGLNRIQYTTDAYLGLPTDILGTEYVVLGYGGGGCCAGTELAVVATQNGTAVTITPSASTGGYLAGVPFVKVLNQGEAYQLIADDVLLDLSGTIVTSTLPVGVWSGHVCANVPPDRSACDHVVEQMVPTSTWGRNFVTVPLATRLNGDTFRVAASVDATNVSVNGSLVATLNRGQVFEQIINVPSQIVADQPIMVAQFSNSSTYDGVTSDPFEMLIPPFEQFQSGYTITTPGSGFTLNFVNIVAPAVAVGAVLVDGVAVPPASFTAIGSSGFVGAQVPVSVGSHSLSSPLPFGAFVYGFADFDSYGYPGGMALAPVATVTAVTLTTTTGDSPLGQPYCVTATAVDQFGAPVAGVRMDFDVTGSNPGSGFSSTDASGHATFCYTGTHTGDDSIVASVGSITDSTAKTWAPPAGEGCVRGEDYWEDHPAEWPVSAMTLGTVSYSKRQLLKILEYAEHYEGKSGNGLVALADDLIAARLNQAAGASVPPAVAAAMASADVLIGGKIVPPVGHSGLAKSSVVALAATLDAYNKGQAAGGPASCAPPDDTCHGRGGHGHHHGDGCLPGHHGHFPGDNCRGRFGNGFHHDDDGDGTRDFRHWLRARW